MKEIGKNNKSFEDIKHIDENGVEFWYARELMPILQYSNWQNFEKIIDKAKISCKNSGISVFEHFIDVSKLSKRANNAEVEIKDYELTRYACYLIAQNGDSRKKVIALAQTYFAVQTRKQEITEKEYSMLTEDEKRFYQRNLTRKGNYSLNQTAKKAGVKNFDKFHNAGYKGLYNGETADDIAKRKGLRYREDILDNMGSDELIEELEFINRNSHIDFLIFNKFDKMPVLAIEVDGYFFHNSEKQKCRDQKKDNILKKYFPLISDYVGDEKQQEKIDYIVNGFLNVSAGINHQEDTIIMYYDTLQELSLLDIRVLKCYASIYVGEEKRESISGIMEEYELELAQISMIKEKLVRLGLLESKNDDDIDHNMQEMTKYFEAVKKGKKLPSLKLKRIRKSESYKLTRYGRRFIIFFLNEYKMEAEDQ